MMLGAIAQILRVMACDLFHIVTSKCYVRHGAEEGLRMCVLHGRIARQVAEVAWG